MSVFKEYFVDTIKERYAKFDGRARRSEYWYFVLFYVIIYIALATLSGVIAGALGSSGSSGMAMIPMGLVFIFILGMLIPNLAVSVRRLHDTGKSGWWVLIAFVPLVGSIILIVFLCTDSEPGSNMYGPNPKSLSAGTGNASDHLLGDL